MSFLISAAFLNNSTQIKIERSLVWPVLWQRHSFQFICISLVFPLWSILYAFNCPLAFLVIYFHNYFLRVFCHLGGLCFSTFFNCLIFFYTLLLYLRFFRVLPCWYILHFNIACGTHPLDWHFSSVLEDCEQGHFLFRLLF
jgi:hypothetical protein